MNLLNTATIICLVHMANMVMGIAFGTAATIWQNSNRVEYKGNFSYINNTDISADNKPINFPITNNRLALASSEDFKKIPGAPIAYWVKDTLRESFKNNKLANYAVLFQGIITGDNNKYVRYWFELKFSKIALHRSDINEVDLTQTYWIPYNKGGESRNWYGNHEYVVNFRNNGRDFTRGKHQFSKYFLKPCFSWTYISSSSFAARYFPDGFIWDVAGSSVFPTDNHLMFFFLSLIASKVGIYLLDIINPTYNFQVENIAAIPVIFPEKDHIETLRQSAEENIKIAKDDWDLQETSWDFTSSPIIVSKSIKSTIEQTYKSLYSSWKEMTNIVKSNEEIINRIFIGIYQLDNELESKVNIERVTLKINPYYRYSGESSNSDKDSYLLADTMKEFISYSVGCMFGRYSLDKPGLILANQGHNSGDYYKQVPQPQFPPDEDNVIPILEEGWFTDDITERFKSFLRVTFGDEHYEENLAFIENAIGRDIRSYFLKDFYNEHVQMYKKRPIYWMFSSPNGNFTALIYMHRYQPDAASVILNNYLREYVRKLNAHKAHLEDVSSHFGGSQAEKTKATKEINELNKVLAELKQYEDEVLYPLATRQIQIDLDDGVKVNYNKFGKALRKVNGLSE